ncbi:hypothetical protein ACFYZN_20155 [Streptomyces sp. NPDC001777]|uniref:hypothetical protein n=1 Tax=Streptomyces sp. NPDC001777 TaxID=3364608 RepID=UPI00367B824D
MTDEGRTSGRLRGTGRCATCFEAFNPACPRARLDEETREVPRGVSAPAKPLPPASRPRTTAGPSDGADRTDGRGTATRPRVVVQPPSDPRPETTARPAGPTRSGPAPRTTGSTPSENADRPAGPSVSGVTDRAGVAARPPAAPRPRAADPADRPGAPATEPGRTAPLPGVPGAGRSSAPVRDPRRPRTDTATGSSPWQERTAPRATPGTASPAPTPGASGRPRTATPGAAPVRTPRSGAAAPGRAEAPATEGGTSR